MALKNFGPDKKVTETKFFMPLYYNVAASAEIYGEKGDPSYLTIVGESAFAADYELRAHVGAEAWFQNIFALRAGYKINYDTDSFTAGAGLKYEIAGDRSLTVDVAYADMGELFSAPIRVTVGGDVLRGRRLAASKAGGHLPDKGGAVGFFNNRRQR